jgi:hypothetical protein
MKGICRLVVLTAAFGLNVNAWSYEEITHQFLSQEAAINSILTSTALTDLNLSALNAPTLDYTTSTGVPGNALSLITFGALWEDDGPTNRSVQHFYDPQFNHYAGRGLSLPTGTFFPSPQWALEDTGDVTSAVSGVQNNSYRQAEQYFYSGLITPTAAGRAAYFSSMFQSLGQVVHHIQDMAQPQHTRNDIHPPFLSLERSWYERYTGTQFPTQSAMHSFLLAHPYSGSPPNFASVRQYWSTNTAGATTPLYVGMAEFTAENFVSADTEFQTTGALGAETILPNPNFPYPNGSGKSVVPSQPVTIGLPAGGTYNGVFDFLMGTAYDGYTNSTSAPLRLAASSLWDPFVRGTNWNAGSQRILVENTKVFDDVQTVLLPRAVVFSTGLINHFFRGRLNIQRQGLSGTTWTVFNLSASPVSGSFNVYAEDPSGVRTPVSGGPWTATIAAGGTTAVTFQEPPASTANLVVVFTGQIGTEPQSQSDPGWYAVAGRVAPYTSACGGTITSSGSSAGLVTTVNDGSTPGPVQVGFQAFTIPDGLEIRAGSASGAVLATTSGLVSGYHTFTIQFDPTQLGSTNLYVHVTGNSDTGTEWTLAVSCPNQALPTIPIPQVSVHFGDDPTQGLGCYSGLHNVYVDGTYIGNLIYNGNNGSGSFYATLAKGSEHQYQIVDQVTGTGSPGSTCTGDGKIFYDDDVGRHFFTSASGNNLNIQ